MLSKPQTWDNINENGASRKLPMGGYVAIIRKVTDVDVRISGKTIIIQ